MREPCTMCARLTARYAEVEGQRLPLCGSLCEMMFKQQLVEQEARR